MFSFYKRLSSEYPENTSCELRFPLLMPRILTQIRSPFGLGILGYLGILISCSSPTPPPSKTDQESAVAALTVLSQNKINEIANSFDELVTMSYHQHDRTENRSANSYESSHHVVHLDRYGSVTNIIGEDSVATTDLSGLIDAMISDDAPYLSERFKDEFFYQIEVDTTYWSYPTHQITIQARPGNSQDVLSASYIYDAASGKILSVGLHNYSNSILFEESSRYQFQLRPVGRDWLPYRLSAHTTLKLPFGQEQIFARNVTFYNYSNRSTN